MSQATVFRLLSIALVVVFIECFGQTSSAALIAHWNMNETTGLTLSDSVSAYTATATVTPSFGTASPAPGSTGSIQAGSGYATPAGFNTAVQNLQSYTTMLWLKDNPIGAGNNFPIVLFGSGDVLTNTMSGSSFQMEMDTGDNVSGGWPNNRWYSNQYDSNGDGTGTGPSGWHHYAWVFDGNQANDADKGKFYIDGVLVGTSSTSSNTLTGTPSAMFLLGPNAGSGAQVVGNFVDDMWFYGSASDSSGALTQAQIQAHIPEPATVILSLLGLSIYGVGRRVGHRRRD